MEILDIFKREENQFEELYQSIENKEINWKLNDDTEAEILSWNDEKKSLLAIDIINRINEKKEYNNKVWSVRRRTFNLLFEFLAKRKIQYGQYAIELLSIIFEGLQQVIEYRKGKRSEYNYDFFVILDTIFANMLRFHKFESEDEKEILRKMKPELVFFDKYHKNEIAKITQKIGDVLFEGDANSGFIVPPTYFIGDDELKAFANAKIDSLKESQKQLCFQIMALAQKATGGKPSKKFLDDSKKLIEAFGNEQFKIFSHEIFDFVIAMKESIDRKSSTYGGQMFSYEIISFLNPLNIDVLKGWVWMSSKFHDNKTITTISKLAERSFRKIPEKGQAATSLGNACLYTLYASKGLDGIAQLSKLKLKVKQNATLILIEKYIVEAANKLGITAAEVEDLSVDDFKLSNHKIEVQFDDVKAVLELIGIGKSTLRWFKNDGKEQKTVPQSVKDKYADKLKKLKEKQKQIDQTTSVQKERLDRMLRSKRILSVDYFNEKFVNHGLLSFVIDKVIFQFSNETQTELAIFINREWRKIDYKELNINEFTKVELWHPATSSTQEVKQWRQFLMASEIQQPFKQAYREIYLLTDAEINTRTYSNRMASHILKQHQYVTLAKGRNWKARLMGAWEGGDDDTAELLLPEYRIKVEFWVNALNADNEFNNNGIWNYVTTDQIRFVNSETNQLMELIDVPTIAFSEAMRDVDLFVGVASVGNDPTWSDSGGLPTYRDYWQAYSFGDLSEVAKNRKETLQNLVPRLKIASVATVSDKFLVVKGKLRTYKIHIGSTNILMEPNDQYLCIVADRSKKNEAEKVFLPFEGDSGLSVIISKAFLLANDDKITDPTITSQINR